MRHDEFIGEVQHRAKLPSRGDAERVTRVTLETLGERLQTGDNLAAQLPPEIGRHLSEGSKGFERLSLQEFLQRVEEQLGDGPTSVFHARCVIDVLRDAVGDDTVQSALQQLPDEFRQLFESGCEGELGDVGRPLGSVSRDDWGNRSGSREREDAGTRS